MHPGTGLALVAPLALPTWHALRSIVQESSKMNRVHVSLGLGIAAVIGSALLAQEPKTQPTAKPPEARASERALNHDQKNAASDEILVQWLLVANENEVEFARIAVSRAQSPEVKQFAQKMIDDHTACVQKLKQHAGTTGHADRGVAGRGEPGSKKTGADGTGNTGSTGSERTGTERSGEQPGQGNTGNDSQAQPASTRLGSSGEFDHVGLVRDLGKKCRESHTRILQEKQGAEFDKCYMTMAVGAHVHAVDTLEVFKDYASAELRPKLEESLRTVQAHLQQAKQLCKSTEIENKGNK
jgi:predicted outer membrane protein